MDLFDTLPKIGNKSVFHFASLGGEHFFGRGHLLERGRFFKGSHGTHLNSFGVSTNKIGFSGFNMGRRESTILKHEVLQGPSTASSLHDFTCKTRIIT